MPDRQSGRSDDRASTTSSGACYPGKRIVIAEFGWPSAGYNCRAPIPDRSSRHACCAISSRAPSARHRLQHHRGLRSAVEDQRRQRRPVLGHVRYLAPAEVHLDRIGRLTPSTGSSRGLALLLGLLLSLPILARQPRHRRRGIHPCDRRQCSRRLVRDSSSRSGRRIISCSARHSLSALGDRCCLSRLWSLRSSASRRSPQSHSDTKPRRLIAGPLAAANGFAPKVSIHIPAYREPPEMLKATLDAVARLDYPNFECIIVINNTPDPAFWRPIEEHCRALGDRFKFVREDNVAGLQGGRVAACARSHRRRRRDHRRDRRRLRGPARLAEGSGAGLRRSQGRDDPGSAGSSRRRAHA